MSVSCRGPAISRTVGTQTEVLCRHTGVQAPGCGECQTLARTVEDDRDNTCVRSEQVNNLLNLAAEKK